MSDERDDERISEGRLLQWEQYIAGAEDDWWSRAPMRVGEVRRLIAACRARRDEGGGQSVTVPRAWLSVLAQRAFGEGWMRGRGVEPAQGALAGNGLLGTVHGDWETSQAAIEGEIDAALLARRATATATPAGDGKETR